MPIAIEIGSRCFTEPRAQSLEQCPTPPRESTMWQGKTLLTEINLKQNPAHEGGAYLPKVCRVERWKGGGGRKGGEERRRREYQTQAD